MVGSVLVATLRLRLGGRVVGSVMVATPDSVNSFRLRLGGGVVGSVLVATPGSVHSTFLELQLLIITTNHIHIPPRPLLIRLRHGLRLKVRA